MEPTTGGAVALWLSFGASFICNILFIVTFVCRKRQRTSETLPINIVLISVAAFDLTASALWTLPAAVLAATGNDLPVESQFDYELLCKVQGFTMELHRLLNAYIFIVLAFERLLRVFKPAKHREVFTIFNIILLLVGVLILAGYIASQVVWGWGEIKYMPNQYQCAINYEQSTSHFIGVLVLGYWLPICIIIGFYIAVLVRVQRIRNANGSGKPVVLETHSHLRGEAYSDRLYQQHAVLEGIAAKDCQAKLSKDMLKETQQPKSDKIQKDKTNADNHIQNGASENNKQATSWFATFKLDVKAKAKADRNNNFSDLKNQYIFSSEDLSVCISYVVISILFFGLWLLYVVWSLRWTYILDDHFANDNNIVLVAVCLTHFTPCCKVPVYMISARFRAAVMKTVGFGGK